MKVAIIGAGISGLYLAWKLAEKGEDVSVFEKKQKIGKEVCSGLFSDRILEFIPPSRNLIQNRISSVLIHLPERSEGWRRTNVLRLPRRTLKVKFKRQFLVMDHAQLDNLTAELATKAGADIYLGEQIKSWPSESEADRIIGCDGANSFVRQTLTNLTPKLCLAIQGFISKKDSADWVETWPTAAGFIWKIPRGINTEYGIMESPSRAKRLFDIFLKKEGLFLYWQNSAIIPQGLIVPNNPKITLCGDAAGLTKPWSGGGVIWGLTAADLLLKNFPDFLKYKNEVKKFFLPQIIYSKIAKKLVYFAGFNVPWLLPGNYQIDGDFLI